ncbi:MAG: hypothetical protein Q3M30_11745 [Candidatus Electrothrix sp. Rat3]|nr:hypothetical protein [Candidatus Electrothrix rattekaaiensis]
MLMINIGIGQMGSRSLLLCWMELRASDREIEARIGPISTPESWRQCLIVTG